LTDHYATLAERATRLALSNMLDGLDASAELSLAVAADSAAWGEASESIIADLDEYELTDDGFQLRRDCACPTDLRARGGFRSSCPVHGVG
jgi:hypothetical protein